MDITTASETGERVLSGVSEAVIADAEFLQTVLAGVFARGHVLIEDVPGTGKTLTARSLASALGLSFNRIQFTPDLLPGDITGSHIYNEQQREFEFTPGPIFSNVVLADEINRAPPKTQAALLEAMGEQQVSVDDETRQLPDPFFVIATQNPIEQEGTFVLPEAQRDRFMIKTAMGYPNRAGERELLDRRAGRTTKEPGVSAVASESAVREIQSTVERVDVDSRLRDYIVEVCRATRADSRVETGVSPRGVQRLFEVSRARAMLHGREYVVPEDVKALAHPVLDHRIVLTSDARIRETEASSVVDSVLSSTEVPAMNAN